jgi:hypothetical protein
MNGNVFRQFPFTSQRSDFDATGTVDGADLGFLLDAWMRCIEGDCNVFARFDLNDDRQIDGADLGSFLMRGVLLHNHLTPSTFTVWKE